MLGGRGREAADMRRLPTGMLEQEDALLSVNERSKYDGARRYLRGAPRYAPRCRCEAVG